MLRGKIVVYIIVFLLQKLVDMHPKIHKSPQNVRSFVSYSVSHAYVLHSFDFRRHSLKTHTTISVFTSLNSNAMTYGRFKTIFEFTHTFNRASVSCDVVLLLKSTLFFCSSAFNFPLLGIQTNSSHAKEVSIDSKNSQFLIVHNSRRLCNLSKCVPFAFILFLFWRTYGKTVSVRSGFLNILNTCVHYYAFLFELS